MKKRLPILLTAVLLIFAGCGEKEEPFSRYPSLAIPEYGVDDYIRDLSSADSEVVYNAICNLSSQAHGFGNALWGEKSDPESGEYQNAQRVYEMVRAQLQSKEPMLVAVSLRFLQKLGNIRGQTELIEQVSAMSHSSPLIQYEQVKLLSVLITEESTLPEPLLERMINSDSLIISGAAYGLLGQLSDERWREELRRRYHASDDEIEQLVLLAAYGRSPSAGAVEFFQQEMLVTGNPKIRQCAFDVLNRNINSPDVQSWIIDNFPKFSPEEQTKIFECNNDDGDECFELLKGILSQGYDPGDEWLQTMASCLEYLPHAVAEEDNEEEILQECQALMRQFEQILLSVPELAARLEPMRAEVRLNIDRVTAMQAEYDLLAEEFSDKTRVFLTKHGVSEEEQEKFIKAVPGLKTLEIYQKTIPF